MRDGFNYACRISYDFLHLINSSNLFGRVPVKMRLFVAMIESADSSGRVRDTIHALSEKMPVAVNDKRLYEARDELAKDGIITIHGKNIYINPKLAYKGQWKEGAYFKHLKDFETMNRPEENNDA